jgi:hypothetical protein
LIRRLPLLPTPPAPAVTLQDIAPTWDSVIKILEYNVGLSQFAGPTKGWLDLDMLYGGWLDTLVLVEWAAWCMRAGSGELATVAAGQANPQAPPLSHTPHTPRPCCSASYLPPSPAAVGNIELGEYRPFGPFFQEQRLHFALWALFKSPLMIGHDLRKINTTFLNILKAKVGAASVLQVCCNCAVVITVFLCGAMVLEPWCNVAESALQLACQCAAMVLQLR